MSGAGRAGRGRPSPPDGASRGACAREPSTPPRPSPRRRVFHVKHWRGWRPMPALLVKWQKAINLVAPDSLPDLWRRHMLDSAPLLPLIPATARILVDLGSGAGFPGLVLAIMAGAGSPPRGIRTRKCAFLSEGARLFAPGRVTVHRARIEAAPGHRGRCGDRPGPGRSAQAPGLCGAFSGAGRHLPLPQGAAGGG